MSDAMFVTVKYGESRSEIFNPNCRIISLLKDIRDRCRGFDAEEVELSDENGNVKFLRDSPNKYANEILTERENFVLLKVDKNDKYISYSPLLIDSDAITDDFLARLAVRDDTDGSSDTRRGKAPKRSTSDKSIKQEKPSTKMRLAKSITSVVRSRSRSGKTPS
ncbi:hypothetical protein LOTGIDRAFT_239178 [Lottia gigantea]|uniref:Uncharacterized protein n=1 Tax=Lottia gigantea TaxID=225164 RepID=V4AJ83_LOTGI|nr:hypothetical protein LOTGIDRAFT_239178 [Lottia gigantea]ESO97142.1 hypothetical protein LOTGIDRAFT_239178 [Lottia gigantea]